MEKKPFKIILRNDKNKESFDLRGHYWFYRTNGIEIVIDSECKWIGDGGGSWEKLSTTCIEMLLNKNYSEIYDLVDEYHRENYL